MPNSLYFAIFPENLPELSPAQTPAYMGFGYTASGHLTLPYASLPEGSVIVLNDRHLPAQWDVQALNEYIRNQQVQTVICDFEQPPCQALARVSRELTPERLFVPESYASAAAHTGVLLAPYVPREPFSSFLAKKKQQFGTVLLDMKPIAYTLAADGKGVYEPVALQMVDKLLKDAPRYDSEALCCHYGCFSDSGNSVFVFYDSAKSFRHRADLANASGILLLQEYPW